MANFNDWKSLNKLNNYSSQNGWGFVDDRARALSNIIPGITNANSQWIEATVFSQIGTLIDGLWQLTTCVAPVGGKYPYRDYIIDASDPSAVPSGTGDTAAWWFGSQDSTMLDSLKVPENLPYRNVFENLMDHEIRLLAIDPTNTETWDDLVSPRMPINASDSDWASWIANIMTELTWSSSVASAPRKQQWPMPKWDGSDTMGRTGFPAPISCISFQDSGDWPDTGDRSDNALYTLYVSRAYPQHDYMNVKMYYGHDSGLIEGGSSAGRLKFRAWATGWATDSDLDPSNTTDVTILYDASNYSQDPVDTGWNIGEPSNRVLTKTWAFDTSNLPLGATDVSNHDVIVPIEVWADCTNSDASFTNGGVMKLLKLDVWFSNTDETT
jgi:hypothetical protein